MTSEPPVGGPGGEPPQWEELLRSMFGADADEAMRELRARGMDPAAMAAAAGLPADPASLGHVLAQVQRLLAASGDGPVNWDVAHDVARPGRGHGGRPVADPDAGPRGDRGARPSPSCGSTPRPTCRPRAAARRRGAARSGSSTPCPRGARWPSRWPPRSRTRSRPRSAASSPTVSARRPRRDSPASACRAARRRSRPGVDPTQLLRQLGSAVFGMQVGPGRRDPLPRGVRRHRHRPAAAPRARHRPAADQRRGVRRGARRPDRGGPPVPRPARGGARAPVHARHLAARAPARHRRDVRARHHDRRRQPRGGRPLHRPDRPGRAAGGAVRRRVRAAHHAGAGRRARRLETALALVEGWVDEVTATAALPHLPHAVALREMIRRRRAAGGPAEQTFATLVGLELRPRRSRDAAALWAQIARDGGTTARDAVWDHPDLLPTRRGPRRPDRLRVAPAPAERGLPGRRRPRAGRDPRPLAGHVRRGGRAGRRLPDDGDRARGDRAPEPGATGSRAAARRLRAADPQARRAARRPRRSGGDGRRVERPRRRRPRPARRRRRPRRSRRRRPCRRRRRAPRGRRRPRGTRAPARCAGRPRARPRTPGRGRSAAGASARAAGRSRGPSAACRGPGSEMRIVPSTGVHDPQRRPWREDHVTLVGRASPPRYRSDSSAARSASPSSDGRRRRSCAASRVTIRCTHSRSWARVNRAGMDTTVVSPSRNAVTVRTRLRLRRTSMGPGRSDSRHAVDRSRSARRDGRRSPACRPDGADGGLTAVVRGRSGLRRDRSPGRPGARDRPGAGAHSRRPRAGPAPRGAAARAGQDRPLLWRCRGDGRLTGQVAPPCRRPRHARRRDRHPNGDNTHGR